MKQKHVLSITGTDQNISTKENILSLQELLSVILATTDGIFTALTSVGLLVITTHQDHQDFTVCSCSGPHPLVS